MRKLFFLIIFSSFSAAYSQGNHDYNFINHLLNTDRVKEANDFIEFNPSLIGNDSIRFLWGKSEFYLKNYKKAELELSNINLNHPYKAISNYYIALSRLYEGIPISKRFLQDSIPKQEFSKLLTFGNSIIEDPYNVDSSFSNLEFSNNLFKRHYLDLYNYSKALPNKKRKSPFLAGLMSAVIPGSGKLYSGRIGEGFASLLLVSIFSVSTVEQYRNGGFNNPQFYLIGIPALLFYSGNIYGSYFSVNVQNLEFQDKIQNEVLFHLHIPFKSFYKQ